MADALAIRDRTPVGVLNCPSRRAGDKYQMNSGNAAYNSSHSSAVARSDYAVNGGDLGDTDSQGWSYWAKWAGPSQRPDDDDPSYQYVAGSNHKKLFPWPDVSVFSGISFPHSEVAAADIRDGLSNTYLLGEKYVHPAHYLDGADPGDDWSMFTGHQNDIARSCWWSGSGDEPTQAWTPMQDSTSIAKVQASQGLDFKCENRFGSAHSASCNFVFCDGSVHAINYLISPEVHQRLGNRADGLPVDITKL
jgi:prepilin-type processing-associated H-X9-DG protein